LLASDEREIKTSHTDRESVVFFPANPKRMRLSVRDSSLEFGRHDASRCPETIVHRPADAQVFKNLNIAFTEY
jgi:hypothetical protein